MKKFYLCDTNTPESGLTNRLQILTFLIEKKPVKNTEGYYQAYMVYK